VGDGQFGRRAVRGSFYSVTSSGVTLILGLIRSIVVTSLLLPDDVGVFRQAVVFIVWLSQISNFGLDSALIHREDDLEQAFSTHFILNLGLNAFVVIVSLLAAPFLLRFYPNMPGLSQVFIVLAGLEFLKAFNYTPLVMLTKELHFKNIAIIDIISSIGMTIVAPIVAYLGYGFWALVAERASGIVLRTGLLWLYFRPWTLNLRFDLKLVRWFMGFGSKVFVSRSFSKVLDQFDEFWIGTTLGKSPLGFYAKAYEFAGYPERTVGNPIMSVIFPTFAKVQHDRLRLSKAFFRASSLIVRAGFLIAGVFTLVIPEFIRLFLGDQWIPMALTFQLMLIYTLLNPLYTLASRLTTAVGRPQVKIWVQLLQLVIFIPSVIATGKFIGIEGVALAADVMMLTGVLLLFKQVRQYVDISYRTLLGWPTVGLIISIGVIVFLNPVWQTSSDWVRFLGKTSLMTGIYGIILLITERDPLIKTADYIWNLVRTEQSP